ncbi:hypothetical protein WEI85_04080 [Actinomycetes bacterium KLBMP 9797]
MAAPRRAAVRRAAVRRAAVRRAGARRTAPIKENCADQGLGHLDPRSNHVPEPLIGGRGLDRRGTPAMARHGAARRGTAGHGGARRGTARHGGARRGTPAGA